MCNDVQSQRCCGRSSLYVHFVDMLIVPIQDRVPGFELFTPLCAPEVLCEHPNVIAMAVLRGFFTVTISKLLDFPSSRHWKALSEHSGATEVVKTSGTGSVAWQSGKESSACIRHMGILIP